MPQCRSSAITRLRGSRCVTTDRQLTASCPASYSTGHMLARTYRGWSTSEGYVREVCVRVRCMFACASALRNISWLCRILPSRRRFRIRFVTNTQHPYRLSPPRIPPNPTSVASLLMGAALIRPRQRWTRVPPVACSRQAGRGGPNIARSTHA